MWVQYQLNPMKPLYIGSKLWVESQNFLDPVLAKP